MNTANLPIEKAHEPEEEAYQPLPQIMPPVPNRVQKRVHINIAEDEKPDSQSSSSYKDALSQPADCETHRERLIWLQKRRTQGLWAQCDDCNRWRYLPDVLDRYDLPKKWYCRLNRDTTFASCSAPEIPIRIHDEEDLIHSEYNAGSLVLARINGWPWWPAMVDDCPDTEQYYWLDGFSDIPTHYNVVFFDSFEVTRAWLSPSQLKPYKEGKKIVDYRSLANKSYRKRLEVAVKQANEAEKLTLIERLAKYSFIARYKGTIATPKIINRNVIKKHHEQFKRKFSVAFPNELSDSENEVEIQNINVTKTPKKRNVITIGTKKVNEDIDVETNLSTIAEVDTNSDPALANDMATSTTYAADTTVPNTVEECHETLDRTCSPGSEDFDF